MTSLATLTEAVEKGKLDTSMDSVGTAKKCNTECVVYDKSYSIFIIIRRI